MRSKTSSKELPRKPASRVRTGVIVLVAVFVMGAAAIVARWDSKEFEKSTVHQLRQQLATTARAQALNLEDAFRDIEMELQVLARAPETVAAFESNKFDSELEAGDQLITKKLHDHLGWIADSVYRVNARGIVMGRVPYIDNREGIDYSEKLGIRKALATGNVAVSDMFRTESDRQAVSVCVPVRNKRGRMLGVLRVLIYLKTIEALLDRAGVGDVTFLILESDEVVLAHPNPLMVGHRLCPGNPAHTECLGATLRQVDPAGDGSRAFAYLGLCNVDGEKNPTRRYIVLAPALLPERTWTVGAEVEYDRILTPVRHHMLRTYGITAAIAICFVVFLAFAFHGTLSRRAILTVNRDLEKLVDARTNELVKAKEEAESASNAKGDFLATMSHEIRTPLTGIIGTIEILQSTELSEEQRSLFAIIQSESNSLLGLINQILDFSKIEAGGIEIENEEFNLRQLMEEVVGSFSLKALQKGIDLIMFLHPNAPENVVGDSQHLRQVMVNLLGNAMKFTEEGHIFFEAQVEADDDEAITYRFIVKDSGIGIPDDKRVLIFDCFQQADGSTSRRYGGTGLGTTIAKRLVELMGGEIGLESKEGEGTTFWFKVRFLKQGGVMGAISENELKGKRVLIVDPSRENGLVLEAYLKAAGCMVTQVLDCECAQSAIDVMDDGSRFELLLVDMEMLDDKESEINQLIQKDEHLQHAKIIGLTASRFKALKRAVNKEHLDGMLSKTVKRSELIRLVAAAMEGGVHPKEEKTRPKTSHLLEFRERAGMRILLVDDYPTNRKVVEFHLVEAGYQVDLADNGQKAIDLFRVTEYNAVLMDVEMPVMDGYEASRRIREMEEKRGSDRRTPIIALTAHAVEGFEERCINAGMDEYVTKPIKKEEFFPILEGLLNGQKPRGTRVRLRRPTSREPAVVIPEKRSSNADVMDWQRAINVFMNKPDFLLTVAEQFVDTVDSQLEKILSAGSAGNAGTVRSEAHTIKGGARNLCADGLAELAEQLEDDAEKEILENVRDLVGRMRYELKKMDEFLKGKRQSGKAESTA